MKLKLTFFLLFFQFVFVSFLAQETNTKSSVSLLSTQISFNVNDDVILDFKVKKDTILQLYCSNSYGSTVLKSKVLDQKASFKVPRFLSKKRGILTWKTINTDELISGNISIHSQQQPTTIETYLGPPSIDAGELDYTMLVVIPTDSLDNPILDNSKVDVKYQFLKSENINPIYTDKLIGYKNIYAPKKSGRMIISSTSFGLNSKEFDVNIMPAIATDFEIFMHRNHEYADGNQITTLFTSIVKDKNQNIISDGSYIEFYITDKKGGILKTAGTTINGVAHAKIVHPDFEDTWRIKAYFIGISESNTITIKYKKVIEDYNIAFKENNRVITVGPLESFMGQIIPDGLSVKLSIYKNGILLKDLFKESNNGFASFYLDANIYENDTYKIILETAGIKKEFKSFKLW
ncbi:hypothetical protein [Polaribacter sp. Hel1_85]|uniref:hypothetical protein n=1 Tax=Polaribacter sp. Hel1_85 TaxID=1250005 RepID=UPI00052B7A45|nr:hypothetical protein [Polaribacter sp. Hel1_85]KGL63827.1 hypothetical protein PHEL85_0868 [Polaribacter sp. Hel1_85]